MTDNKLCIENLRGIIFKNVIAEKTWQSDVINYRMRLLVCVDVFVYITSYDIVVDALFAGDNSITHVSKFATIDQALHIFNHDSSKIYLKDNAWNF